MAPPQNQVVFTANLVYSDDSTAPLTSGVKWTYDFAPWVSLSGNTATCTRPADAVLGIPMSSQINASTTVNGTSYTNLSLLYCL
jgi:hypothetical protein